MNFYEDVPSIPGVGGSQGPAGSSGPPGPPGSSGPPGPPGSSASVSVTVASSSPSIFNIFGNPIQSSGIITLQETIQSSGLFFAGPTSANPQAPTFRAITQSDLPSPGYRQISSSANTVPTDRIIAIVATSSSSGFNINLTGAGQHGTANILYIKDENGTCTRNNITVVGFNGQKIDGQTSTKITINFGVLRLYSNGVFWLSL